MNKTAVNFLTSFVQFTQFAAALVINFFSIHFQTPNAKIKKKSGVLNKFFSQPVNIMPHKKCHQPSPNSPHLDFLFFYL
jgi:hypothetical protein